MDDFSRRLEIELAHLLDPIVDVPVPRRRRQSTLRALAGGLVVQAEVVAVVHEPVPAVGPAVTTTT